MADFISRNMSQLCEFSFFFPETSKCRTFSNSSNRSIEVHPYNLTYFSESNNFVRYLPKSHMSFVTAIDTISKIKCFWHLTIFLHFQNLKKLKITFSFSTQYPKINQFFITHIMTFLQNFVLIRPVVSDLSCSQAFLTFLTSWPWPLTFDLETRSRILLF